MNPDRNVGDEEAVAKFKVAQEAYDKIYDWKLNQEKSKNGKPKSESAKGTKAPASNDLAGLTNKGS